MCGLVRDGSSLSGPSLKSSRKHQTSQRLPIWLAPFAHPFLISDRPRRLSEDSTARVITRACDSPGQDNDQICAREMPLTSARSESRRRFPLKRRGRQTEGVLFVVGFGRFSAGAEKLPDQPSQDGRRQACGTTWRPLRRWPRKPFASIPRRAHGSLGLSPLSYVRQL
jgi:hypothetical protein